MTGLVASETEEPIGCAVRRETFASGLSTLPLTRHHWQDDPDGPVSIAISRSDWPTHEKKQFTKRFGRPRPARPPTGRPVHLHLSLCFWYMRARPISRAHTTATCRPQLHVWSTTGGAPPPRQTGTRTAPAMRAGPPLPRTGGSCVGRPPSTRLSPPIHAPSEGRGRTRGWPGVLATPTPPHNGKRVLSQAPDLAGPPTLGRGEREGPGGSVRGDSRSRVCLHPLSRPLRRPLRRRRMNGRVSTPFHPPPSKRLLGPTFDPCTPGDKLLSPPRCRHTESTLLSVCGHARDSLMAAHRHHPIRQSRPPSVLVSKRAKRPWE